MLIITFYLVSLLHLLLSITATKNPPSYTPDIILLNCGETSNSTSLDGRNWDGDARSKFSTSNFQATSFAAKASIQDTSVTQVPYMTARIFRSKFTYNFPVLPGPKFVRLYFYPTTYSNLDITKSFFSIKANTYTLMNNFSAFLTVSAMNPPSASFIKEFIITVLDNELLNITFTPSPSSYAFVNGIEIVSMPNNLYARGDNDQLTFVGFNSLFYLYNTTALETFYRFNVGGGNIASVDDTGMYRTWRQDLDFIHGTLGNTPIPRGIMIRYTADTPPYTAPAQLYTSSRTMGKYFDINLKYNLTWIFSVDAGFYYLVRLHFCETQMEVTRENQRVFSIFIYNQTAERDADVIQWSGGNGIPVFRDYVVFVPKESQGRQDLWLALHPYSDLNSQPKYADAILNGLEIFKLNKSDGSLAAPNPNPNPKVDPTLPEQYGKLPERKRSRGSSMVMVIIGAVLGGVLLFALSLVSCFFVLKRKRKGKESGMSDHKTSWVPFSYTVSSTNTNASLLPSDLCHRFSIIDIKVATNNFDDNFVIGAGGFGNVYKGTIYDGVTVAIKRLNSSSSQGAHEFETEILMLSKLRYIHLVALIGYCDDQGEMILVYDYMPRGTLRDHLYKTKNQPLPWKQRLQICIGAARGLHYLHTGPKHAIIHRDVKSTNILLDENWVAKVSDFGLSKVGPTSMSQTHVSTMVKGSFGYIDPEYFRRQQLTEKSDVYSFGVVLCEVLCARPSVITTLSNEPVGLVQWTRNCYQRGSLDQIIDPHLRGDIAPVCLKKFVEIAKSCVHDKGIERPTMSDVVWGLEFTLQLQETAEKNINGEDWINVSYIEMNDYGDQESPLVLSSEAISTDDDDLFMGSCEHVSELRSTISSGGRSVIHSDPDRVKSDTVFS